MNPNTCKHVNISIFITFVAVLTYLSSDNFFFWDTIQLASLHAHHFFVNNFSNFILTDKIDSGHIPAFGFYIALCWKIFGKTLFVSHFAMLPFLIGIVFQAYKLIERFIPDKYISWVLLIFFTDPTLLSQMTLVSPDIVLIFFFLSGINSVFDNKKTVLSISVLGLFLVSMRGMMTAVAILLFDIFTNIKKEENQKIIVQMIKRAIIYIPALSIFVLYNYYHFSIKSWIGFHNNSPWKENFKYADLHGVIRNAGIFIWRLIDFGRIILYLIMIFIFIVYRKKLKDKYNSKSKQLIKILFFTTISLIISFISYKSLTAHRYILPIYLLISLLASYIINELILNNKAKIILYIVIATFLLSGNMLIYNEKTAQGWDSSLAHLPYYKLDKEMTTYLTNQKLNKNLIGSAFPNLASGEETKLNGDTNKFQLKNLQFQEYIIYSNIFNDFSDNEIDSLKTKFLLRKEFSNSGVFIRLYQKQH